MIKYVLVIVILISGCAPKITKTKEYKIAVREIQSVEYIPSLELIPNDQLKLHDPLIFGNDTFSLSRNKAFGLISPDTRKRYIFTTTLKKDDYELEDDADVRAKQTLRVKELPYSSGKVKYKGKVLED